MIIGVCNYNCEFFFFPPLHKENVRFNGEEWPFVINTLARHQYRELIHCQPNQKNLHARDVNQLSDFLAANSTRVVTRFSAQ
jgi:hypothetical protein